MGFDCPNQWVQGGIAASHQLENGAGPGRFRLGESHQGRAECPVVRSWRFGEVQQTDSRVGGDLVTMTISQQASYGLGLIHPATVAVVV